jgi:protein O-GlcNAc transferase
MMNDQLASARRLLESGEFDSAESVYREILQDSPQHSDALYGLGLVCFSKKDLAGAEHWFRQSLKANPTDQKTLFYLGVIATARGDKNSAVRLFAMVLALNPEHLGAMNRLSRLAFPGSTGPTTRMT